MNEANNGSNAQWPGPSERAVAALWDGQANDAHTHPQAKKKKKNFIWNGSNN